MDGLLGVAGIIIDSDCGSFPHSLLSTSKIRGIDLKNLSGHGSMNMYIIYNYKQLYTWAIYKNRVPLSDPHHEHLRYFGHLSLPDDEAGAWRTWRTVAVSFDTGSGNVVLPCAPREGPRLR